MVFRGNFCQTSPVVPKGTSGSSISLQRKLIETYQVLASQTEYALGSL